MGKSSLPALWWMAPSPLLQNLIQTVVCAPMKDQPHGSHQVRHSPPGCQQLLLESQYFLGPGEK